ncbi:Uncharacterized protein dnm_048850 [Desulfonema magnum]|uniref:Uncharacterized protein n=1 Tax=Desulfonema magnum TaxID=45655 RepID=A0A975BNN4_9BACT|nr:Uncharacterized protein dnm_048850 [Desulfonema magnum]
MWVCTAPSTGESFNSLGKSFNHFLKSLFSACYRDIYYISQNNGFPQK